MHVFSRSQMKIYPGKPHTISPITIGRIVYGEQCVHSSIQASATRNVQLPSWHQPCSSLTTQGPETTRLHITKSKEDTHQNHSRLEASKRSYIILTLRNTFWPLYVQHVQSHHCHIQCQISQLRVYHQVLAQKMVGRFKHHAWKTTRQPQHWKLCIILLFECDFNNNNKWLGWAVMFHAKEQQQMAREQYGNQKEKLAATQCLNKCKLYDAAYPDAGTVFQQCLKLLWLDCINCGSPMLMLSGCRQGSSLEYDWHTTWHETPCEIYLWRLQNLTRMAWMGNPNHRYQSRKWSRPSDMGSR